MTDAFDRQVYEKLMNDTLPGLTMFVRDADLPEGCAGKYVPGMIIREPGFTDASSRVRGMVTSHRFAILSNHMVDLGAFGQGAALGLCVARPGSHFKVLDVFEFFKKTQILLLHLPDDPRWKMFENMTFSLEKNLIAVSRRRFVEKAAAEPVPELTSRGWLMRCAAPIGMDERGNLFEP